MKYIIFDIGDIGDIELPVVFPDLIQHSDVVAKSAWGKEGTPVSAGFFEIHAPAGLQPDNMYIARGESISLNLKSRPEDSDILTKFFRQCEKL